MAVLGRLLVSSAERLDLPDLLSLDSYAAGDWKYFLKGLVGDSRPYILKGFDVIDPANAIGTQSCSIRVAESVVFYPGSDAGGFFHGLAENHPQAEPIVPELRKNAVNYVYLTFSTFNTSVDTRAFWDPDKDGGVGGEFTQDINTESVLKVEVNVSTGSFPANTIPIAKVTVGPVVITAIEDARDLMFRLGSGGINPNPFNQYAWRSLPGAPYQRSEPPTQMLAGGVNPFQGADKNILTLKEWMDAVMSKLRELGGTTYWYDDTSSFGIVSNFFDAVATAFKSKGKWVHDSGTPGLLTWTEDINIKMTSDPRTYVIRQGSKTLSNEQVMYIAMVRNQPLNGTDESVSWTNGQPYINTIGGAVGLFANLSKGDYVKKANDSFDKWLRVEEFYDAVNMGGSTTTAAGARSVRLSGNYLGTTGAEKGRYDKGAYLASDVLVSDRNNAAIYNSGGNFHWLALRSDTIENVSNIVTTSLSIDIDQHDGSTARVTSAAPHGLVDGDRVTIDGTTNFDGTYKVEVETSTIFYINISGGPFADESGDAYYATITTAARSTPYGFQEESAAHGFNSDDSIIIAGTTNYNGNHKINVTGTTTFTIPVSASFATETAGTATLARLLVRVEGSVSDLIQGQIVDIVGSDAENIRQYLGMNSLAETAPNYNIPDAYNTLDGMQNYNATINENITIRVSKLTAMMADKAQDKTIKYLPSAGITSINNVTNGAAQELTFSPNGSSLTLVTPGSDGQAFIALPGNAPGISLLVNQAAYVEIDRNNPTNLSIQVANLIDIPISENIFVIAVRLLTQDVYLWEGSIIQVGSTPGPGFSNALSMAKLIGGGELSVDGTAGSYSLVFDNSSDTGLADAELHTVSGTPNYSMHLQQFTAPSSFSLAQLGLELKKTGAPVADLTLEIYTSNTGPGSFETLNTNTDYPGTLLGTSSVLAVSSLTTSYVQNNFTFGSPIALTSGQKYWIVTRLNNISVLDTGANSIQIHKNSGVYGSNSMLLTEGLNSNWINQAGVDDLQFWAYEAGISSLELNFTDDMFLELKGLDYSDNTIPSSESPIAFPNDLDVAYVVPNLAIGGPNLSVTVDTLPNIPTNAVIIARRVDDKIIVGQSMAIEQDEVIELDGNLQEINRRLNHLKLSQHETAPAKARIAGSDILQLDDTIISQTMSDLLLNFSGAVINFSTGAILKEDDSTPLGANFTPFSVPMGQYFWYGVSLIPANTAADNRIEAQVQIDPASAANASASAALKSTMSGDIKLGQVQVFNNGGVLEISQINRLGVSSGSGGSGVGSVKVDFIDPISTTLPTGTSVTIDGVSGSNGDLVLFTNLSSGNNRVYKLTGVGVSLVWTAQRAFKAQFDPTVNDSVRIGQGEAFATQLALFDGTNFLVNDTVRFFDGVSADFWELSSIKTSTLADNTTGNVFAVAYAGSENMIVNYSLLRGSIKETGQLFLTTDGTNASITRTRSYIGDSGIDFTATINGSNIELNFASSNLGTPATMKYHVSRWSDSAGGPTGIPSYTGGGGGGGSAGGNNTEIQYNSGGSLAGDARFRWDSALGVVNMNGMQISALSSTVTLNDNQVSPATAVSYSASLYRFVILEYSVQRGTDFRVGRMLISNDGTNIGFSDDFVETNSTGLNFQAVISGGNVLVEYTSTNTGNTGAFKYAMRRWQ